MKGHKRDTSYSSPAIAVAAMFVLTGLLLVPGVFIFYGGGGAALGGLSILGALILCQSVVFAVVKLLASNRRSQER
jgi:hypothetical protein